MAIWFEGRGIPELFLPCKAQSAVAVDAALLGLLLGDVFDNIPVVHVAQYESLHSPSLMLDRGCACSQPCCQALDSLFQLVHVRRE